MNRVIPHFECDTEVVVIGQRCVRVRCMGNADVEQEQPGEERWDKEPNGKCLVECSLTNVRRIRVTCANDNSLVIKLNLTAELLELKRVKGKSLVMEKILARNPPLLRKALNLLVGNLSEREYCGRIHLTWGIMFALEATGKQVDLRTLVRNGKGILENWLSHVGLNLLKSRTMSREKLVETVNRYRGCGVIRDECNVSDQMMNEPWQMYWNWENDEWKFAGAFPNDPTIEALIEFVNHLEDQGDPLGLLEPLTGRLKWFIHKAQFWGNKVEAKLKGC